MPEKKQKSPENDKMPTSFVAVGAAMWLGVATLLGAGVYSVVENRTNSQSNTDRAIEAQFPPESAFKNGEDPKEIPVVNFSDGDRKKLRGLNDLQWSVQTGDAISKISLASDLTKHRESNVFAWPNVFQQKPGFSVVLGSRRSEEAPGSDSTFHIASTVNLGDTEAVVRKHALENNSVQYSLDIYSNETQIPEGNELIVWEE